jgi:quercetin 2,3-dioxygenase
MLECPMIEIRPFATLGHADHGWLNARHHFSFSSYQDPERMGWGAICVWNDDEIAPHTGFAPHPHNDMEIITYVRSGAISHEDSLGNRGRTPAGDVQVMSAGTGIRHSEENKSDELTSLFQIWVVPDKKGEAPHWDQRAFPKADRARQWNVLASGNPETDDALPIRADAHVLGATLLAGETLNYSTSRERHLYLVAPIGSIEVNGQVAGARDGVAITDEDQIRIVAREDCEVVLVDAR